MQHNLTIVSAFIAGINKNPTKSVELYVQYGRQLMNIKIPKILFIDERLVDQVKDVQPEYNTIIPYTLRDIYLYQYLNQLTNVRVISTCPTKDTVEYFMVQCHKTEWIRQAILMNKYHSDQYMWIDFGIYQFIDKLLLSNEEKFDVFATSLYQIEYQKSNVIRIPGMWNMDATCNNFYAFLKKHICWYFAGSLFGGPKDLLMEFATLTKQQCLRMILTESWLVWELNIWYLVYLEHPKMFEQYKAQHDLSIFHNYKNQSVFRIPINQYDGLGNKLKAFIGSLSINYNTKIVSQKGPPYSEFSSILPDKYIFNETKDQKYINYYTCRFLVLKREEQEQPNLVMEYSKHHPKMDDLTYLFSQHYIDWFYDSHLVSMDVKKRLLKSLHSIEFLPHIYQRVDEIAKSLIHPTLTVGIRTWHASHEKNINRPYHSQVYKDQIIEVLNKYPNIMQIFVTIDNDDYLSDYREFMARTGKQVMFYQRQSFMTDLENAIIQVLVAAKCQYMIGNRLCTFSELIYWFSDLKIIVSTVY